MGLIQNKVDKDELELEKNNKFVSFKKKSPQSREKIEGNTPYYQHLHLAKYCLSKLLPVQFLFHRSVQTQEVKRNVSKVEEKKQQ